MGRVISFSLPKYTPKGLNATYWGCLIGASFVPMALALALRMPSPEGVARFGPLLTATRGLGPAKGSAREL